MGSQSSLPVLRPSSGPGASKHCTRLLYRAFKPGIHALATRWLRMSFRNIYEMWNICCNRFCGRFTATGPRASTAAAGSRPDGVGGRTVNKISRSRSLPTANTAHALGKAICPILRAAPWLQLGRRLLARATPRSPSGPFGAHRPLEVATMHLLVKGALALELASACSPFGAGLQ